LLSKEHEEEAANRAAQNKKTRKCPMVTKD
jgi:hypothetical protein